MRVGKQRDSERRMSLQTEVERRIASTLVRDSKHSHVSRTVISRKGQFDLEPTLKRKPLRGASHVGMSLLLACFGRPTKCSTEVEPTFGSDNHQLPSSSDLIPVGRALAQRKLFSTKIDPQSDQRATNCLLSRISSCGSGSSLTKALVR